MNQHFDLVIIGGGCAGLSLAYQLSQFGENCPKTLIIEEREGYSNDRTWCFWDLKEPAHRDLAPYKWKKFSIKNNHMVFEYSCNETPYFMLPSDIFYKNTLSAIESSKNIQLLTGEKLADKVIKRDTWQIPTSKFLVSASKVVDTRPIKTMTKKDSLMWQSFVGYEIEVESPQFIEDQLVLMDFDSNFKEGLAFIYCLPTSNSKALIEYTVFSEDLFIAEQLTDRLLEKINEYTKNTSYKIIRKEAGILPMGHQLIEQNDDPTYLFAGLFAGAARPSSGYAFQRIQTWSKDCAFELKDNHRLLKFKKDSWMQTWMDLLFITVIKKNPTIGAKIFVELFKNCDVKTVANFMSDHSSFWQKLKIIASLPALTFLSAIPELIRSKRRLGESIDA
jgi:lycopene beta-cyclase